MGARARGFTLLEMLVALLVFAALATLVYGMLRIGSRAWESSNARIDQVDTMRIGWTFVHRALSNARRVPTAREEGVGIHFIGRPDALEFVADMPAYLGSGGLHAIALAVEPDAATGRRPLVLRRQLLNDYAADVPDDPDARQEAVLADDVAALQVHYFGRAVDDPEPRWHDTWLEQNALPVLTRVDVRPASGEAWPTLIAHSRFGPEVVGEFDELEPDAGDAAAPDPREQEPADES
jgi:general secretion pathway protein J